MLTRRNFLKASAMTTAVAAMPAQAALLDAFKTTPRLPTPAVASSLSGCLLMEFEAQAFAYAMSRSRRYQPLKAVSKWYVEDGDKVWALSEYYQSPSDGRFVSTLAISYSFAAVNIANMTDHTVWKSRDGSSFNEILSSTPDSVISLRPYA